jgi:hypothetical protein
MCSATISDSEGNSVCSVANNVKVMVNNNLQRMRREVVVAHFIRLNYTEAYLQRQESH